jgi:hypothetical protein
MVDPVPSWIPPADFVKVKDDGAVVNMMDLTERSGRSRSGSER